MSIHFNKVTWYSQLFAILLGIGIFFLGFYLGSNQSYIDNSRIGNLVVPNKPVAFFKPIEFLPAIENSGMISSQSELDTLYPEAYNEDYGEYGDRFKKTNVNFEQSFILYQQVSGGGCSVVVTPTLQQVAEKTLLFESKIYEEGTCEIGLVGIDWIVVPRAYIDFKVNFKTTVTHSDLR